MFLFSVHLLYRERQKVASIQSLASRTGEDMGKLSAEQSEFWKAVEST